MYSAGGAYPSIYSVLDENGEIISERGYALYRPKTKVLKNGSVLFHTDSHFNQAGEVFDKTIIAKTDQNGLIDGCETYPTLLKTQDITIEIDTFLIDTFQIDDVDWLDVDIEPVEFSAKDFCDFPPPPNPNFHLRDTICIGECVQTDSTNNANAHGREWILEADNQSLTVEDSLNFNYCFSEAGTYTLRQTIWFLGVDYAFEKIIEVIPPLEIDIKSDSIICDLPPIDLGLSSNRELKNIRWNTGSDSTSACIYEGGFYSVMADDGYCRAGDSAFYEFVFEKIDTSLAVQLLDTSTVCEVHLPLTIRPTSAYGSLFENESGVIDSVFNISRKGNYEFKTTVHGCDFTKSTFVQIDECKSNIFIPAAFSPNDDGINDEFLPLGDDIEPIQLQIYDRWGGLLFESSDGQLGWRAADSPKGVYVFRFEYVNLLTGLEEEISGDVTVVR